MRIPAVSALVLACLTVGGCTSGAGSDIVVPPAPVAMKTGSISAASAGPMPAADIGEMQAAARPPVRPQPAALAWEGPASQSHAFDGMETTVGMPMPAERPVAALRPTMSETRGERTQIYGHRFRDAKPMNFGRVSPRSLAVHGVDVSRWQGDIDWLRLRTQGANFAYIKATDGGDHVDPMFGTNWRKAKESGVKRGAYHFFYWCRTAGEQAEWFIRNVPRDPDALPPVIDVEYNHQSNCKMRLSRAKILEKMQVFMDKLERHYGKRPIIYTAPDFYADNLDGEFMEYPFWLRSVAAHPTKIYPGRRWVFWQYSGSGLTQGVEGKIDLNVFHGSESDWHNWVAQAN
ncbi:glycosyl hydrolase [Neorhizobium lilium]|uniref:Glycosyl hydrolase n=1 Tax=Neorhizobium lilium TaxID=2503024 RepID=A0A444LMY6_9HYPH|nr:GH25 family lysozyme [Neorhizobium lilium]RWX81719.1 glycosyl hydrolase [Neorhizobium lilium]